MITRGVSDSELNSSKIFWISTKINLTNLNRIGSTIAVEAILV